MKQGFVKIPDVMTGCVLGAVGMQPFLLQEFHVLVLLILFLIISTGLGLGALGLAKKSNQEIAKPYKYNLIGKQLIIFP